MGQRSKDKIEVLLETEVDKMMTLRLEELERSLRKLIPQKGDGNTTSRRSSERTASSTKDPVSSSSRIIPPKATLAPVRGDTFYSPTPRKDKFIERILKNQHVSKETIYQITVIDSKSAVYELVDDPETIRHAMNIPNSYLLPVAEVVGEGRIEDAKDIWVMERGELVKDGQNWRIEKKVRLAYR